MNNPDKLFAHPEFKSNNKMEVDPIFWGIIAFFVVTLGITGIRIYQLAF